MGKKKVRQNSNCIIAPDPSESSDAAIVTKSGNKINCQHLNKAVDVNALRKNFRGNGHLANRECYECRKQTLASTVQDIWFCLRCGTCCCGPEKSNHVVNHFETPHSDTHSIVIKLETLTVWCHECKLEIPPESSQKLHSCVDFVKQQRDRSLISASKKNTCGDTGTLQDGVMTNGSVKNNSLSTSKKLFSVPSSNSKVKGLTNLGNTCFFNSVLQCLAQTPLLKDALSEMRKAGKKFSLPLNDGETFNGELDKGGPLSESLLELLTDMTKSDTNTVVVPRKLLAALQKKCPVFEGGDQQDAHELLRHLLDVVRTEDLRRYQRVILEMNGFTTKIDPLIVAEDKKKWLKDLSQKVSDEFTICPDQVFKGTLVSQLQCQSCFNTSDCYESFLDLSLPVTSEKPVPPVVTRRKNQLASKNDADNEGSSELPQQSTCLSRKEKRQMQKKARNKKKTQLKGEGHGEPSITEEDKKESSDADIEDNDEIGMENMKAEVIESGYSSEKLTSSRTSPTAESQNEIEDSACASPMSISDTITMVNAIANLRLNDRGVPTEEKQCVLSQRSESGLGSSIVSALEINVSAFGVSELTHSMDSSDSIKGNPSSTSRNHSTESLPEIGLLSRDESVSSDHDDTQTIRTCGTLTEGSFIDIISTGKDDSAPDVTDNLQIEMCDRNGKSNESDSVFGSCQNENVVFNNELSRIEYQRNCSSPSTLEYSKQVARSSPVEIACNQSLDSNLLSMSLESYKTEFLSEIQSQGEDDINASSSAAVASAEAIDKIENSQVFTSEKSNHEEMGFVLVGGISCSSNNELSVSKKKSEHVSTFKKKGEVLQTINDNCRVNSGVLSSGNENDHEFLEEVNPEFYKNRHITLAPRYQCSEDECSILSCLNHFTAIEMMAGNNKVGCEACTQRQNKGCKDKEAKTVYRLSTKRLLICSPPPVLILHLKRFQVQRFSFRKLSCHVAFPAVLDLAPFCSDSVQKLLSPHQSQILYSLFGVVAHSGTLRGGHYIAYVKARNGSSEEGKPSSGTWYYVSDSHAREVSEDNVLNSQAYLLFYERYL